MEPQVVTINFQAPTSISTILIGPYYQKTNGSQTFLTIIAEPKKNKNILCKLMSLNNTKARFISPSKAVQFLNRIVTFSPIYKSYYVSRKTPRIYPPIYI